MQLLSVEYHLLLEASHSPKLILSLLHMLLGRAGLGLWLGLVQVRVWVWVGFGIGLRLR